jgi:hypothetical protein
MGVVSSVSPSPHLPASTGAYVILSERPLSVVIDKATTMASSNIRDPGVIRRLMDPVGFSIAVEVDFLSSSDYTTGLDD